MPRRPSAGDLLAISDLHVAYRSNREILERIRTANDGDWLIVAGDVGERLDDIEWALRTLAARFAHVIWVPGNHELWTMPRETSPLRGVARYDHLVAHCRDLGITTPEDPYPTWEGAAGEVRIAPLFLLYDYTFRAPGTSTQEESLAAAYAAGIVCTDERHLYPDPYPTREAWCRARVAATEPRLAAVAGELPLVLVNHWPLLREPTRTMTYQVFPQWCGTELTADWHTRFGAQVAVYGHLHIPRTTHYDGVRFEEVSIGYPREWRRFGLRDDLARLVLPGVPR
ncbi:3',5'-cyclic AMP phosphodiesterase CpdA [Jatrophihabitans endophyticus]|uniref:3',5'-cyclic AMP phosphodiesterase CpdA n=1 Tax=Jatrophihabitans endophyticus TaxID=1206085 RepID=A0A1M5CH71_9ACTN|nr:metallophosphoesterase [Jatrophihabitans endophyticus]SHF54068.1 3',5'-cyclic AMP phosphodiesterase CpdA [Jatrophihabitans endophyticus]